LRSVLAAIRHLESVVTSSRDLAGIVLRYGCLTLASCPTHAPLDVRSGGNRSLF
jgi:hypothetical protein